MTLVEQCLEEYANTRIPFSLTPAEAAKYTMESGAFLIEMESLNALNEVYEADYAVEAEMVRAVAEAKRLGIPVEEGLAIVADKIKSGISSVFNKVKNVLKKIKDTVWSWFENVKKTFRDMFKKPKDFVESNKSDIDAASIKTEGNKTTITPKNGKPVTAEILVYDYTNMDEFPKKQAAMFESMSNSVLADMEKYIKKVSVVPTYYGDSMTQRESAPKYYADLAKEFETRAAKIEEDIKKVYGKSVGSGAEHHLAEFAYFRNGATNENGKKPPKLSTAQYRTIVAESDKIIADVQAMQKKIDKVYNSCISAVQSWENELSSIKVLDQRKTNSAGKSFRADDFTANTSSALTGTLSRFISVMKKLQSCNTTRTNAWIMAAKERAAVALQICKRANGSKGTDK